MRFILVFFLITAYVAGQPLNQKGAFSKADTLRGSNTHHRNWWNAERYILDITPNFREKSLTGSVTVEASITASPKADLQIDLDESMSLNSVTLITPERTNKPLKPKHQGRFYFLPLEKFAKFNTGDKFELVLEFQGQPRIARQPPWDGGWIFRKDWNGNPWMSAAVQGDGASLWFPAKDYWGDEPERGMQFTLNVPEGLTAIGNGQLVVETPDAKRFTWEVVNPINLYNIIPYIGDYVYFSEVYDGLDGELNLDYYVLRDNLEIAKKHFKQVKPMLQCFEDWFGPYPFYEDGYKLVESPYLGMEHQSNIAYGNGYKNGYLGTDLSGSGWGLEWDFIIIHESGHEWFGNNITANDPADMWIHEGFTMYSEIIYTQCQSGLDAANEYAQGLKHSIQNDIPIQGPSGVWQEGSGDMYFKGAAMLHTLRQLVEDDEFFKQALRDLNSEFRHQTVSSQQIEGFLSAYFNKDLTAFFTQYLRTTDIPVLEYYLADGKLHFRYRKIVDGFDMPLALNTSSNHWIFPTKEWKSVTLPEDFVEFKPIDPNFLVEAKEVKKN